MSGPALSLSGVTKTYPRCKEALHGIKNLLFNPRRYFNLNDSDRVEILCDIDLQVPEGEVLGVIGRNGSGKSTLLAIMAGIIRPDRGSVFAKYPASPLLELGAGFHPELSGHENIYLNGLLLGLSKNEVRAGLNEIIAFSGLSDNIHQPLKHYSSGMVARLGFSVAAHLNPQILLIDEILAVGDLNFQGKCVDRIFEFKRRNITIVMASHATAFLGDICDRVLWLENSRVELLGKPEEVMGAYAQALTS